MAIKLTLDELKQHDCYLSMTDKQKHLVIAFLETGSKQMATRAAYGVSEKSARTMSYSLFGNPKIAACLFVAAGQDPERAAFEEAVDKAIRNPRVTQATVTALRLKGLLHGWILPDVPVIPTKSKMAARVRAGKVEIAASTYDPYPKF